MTAGSGIRHSEYNNSKTDPVNFLQIWVFPKEKNVKPRYAQKNFDAANRKNIWQVVVSPDESEGGVLINQDSRFALTNLDKEKTIDFSPKFKGNGVYFFVIEGTIDVDGKKLNRRDAIGIAGLDKITIKAESDSEVLAIEVPMIGEEN